MAEADERWGSQKKTHITWDIVVLEEKRKTYISTFDNYLTTLKHSVNLSSNITHDHT